MWNEPVQHAQGIRLLPWEEVVGENHASRLGKTLKDISTTPSDLTPLINLMIGPEAGLTIDEINVLRNLVGEFFA